MSKAPSTWTIRCLENGCRFRRDKIETKNDAKRHAKAHSQLHGEGQVEIEEIESLPNTVLVGDRIKVKDDAAGPILAACKKAGWDIDLRAIRIVERIDPFGAGGNDRLFVEGPPFAFLRNQVQLAWNNDDERRRALGK